MRKSVLSICMTAGFILFAQSAMAGTQVYVSFGFPVILFEMDGDGPYEDDIWIEGHYSNEYPNYIWVPGYWTPAHHNHAICIQRPPVYRHFHRNAAQEGYCNTPRQSSGNYRERGGDGYNNSWREGYNHQPRNNGQGNGHYNDKGRGNSNHQQTPPQGQYTPRGHDGHRSDNNWMNNINNKVIKRQIHQTPQD